MKERDSEQRDLFVAAAELSGTHAPAVHAHRRGTKIGHGSLLDMALPRESKDSPPDDVRSFRPGFQRTSGSTQSMKVLDMTAEGVEPLGVGIATPESEDHAGAPAAAMPADGEPRRGRSSLVEARQRMMRAVAMLEGQAWGRSSIVALGRRFSVKQGTSA
jgi:hypothetical protein